MRGVDEMQKLAFLACPSISLQDFGTLGCKQDESQLPLELCHFVGLFDFRGHTHAGVPFDLP